MASDDPETRCLAAFHGKLTLHSHWKFFLTAALVGFRIGFNRSFSPERSQVDTKQRHVYRIYDSITHSLSPSLSLSLFLFLSLSLSIYIYIYRYNITVHMFDVFVHKLFI